MVAFRTVIKSSSCRGWMACRTEDTALHHRVNFLTILRRDFIWSFICNFTESGNVFLSPSPLFLYNWHTPYSLYSIVGLPHNASQLTGIKCFGGLWNMTLDPGWNHLKRHPGFSVPAPAPASSHSNKVSTFHRFCHPWYILYRSAKTCT